MTLPLHVGLEETDLCFIISNFKVSDGSYTVICILLDIELQDVKSRGKIVEKYFDQKDIDTPKIQSMGVGRYTVRTLKGFGCVLTFILLVHA